MTRRSYKTNLIHAFLLLILLCVPVYPVVASSHLSVPDKLRYPQLQYKLPTAERIVLGNGMIIYFLEDPELPLVTVNALIRSGTMDDPKDKEGVAELTTYLMRTGGTQKLSSNDIDKQLDGMAASLSIGATLDSAQIDFSLLSKDIDRGLDLLSQIIIMPSFEQKKFMLAKELKSEELRRLKDDPQKLAFREFNRLIYSNDPRGRFSSSRSLKNIEREDLITFHGQFFRPRNIMFAITGDITREAALNKIQYYFGNWLSSGDPVDHPAPAKNSLTGLFYINKEIPQSTIISGQFAPGKDDPDYYIFTVLDFIIGSGGFPSRITSAVRNNEGLAYSAGSLYRARTSHGIFASYAFTKMESTFQTLALIDSIIENARNNTITANETQWAQKSINNGFIFSFTSPEQIAWQQMKIEYNRLPADFLATYRHKIESIKVDDLNKAAAKYLHKNNKITLILGNVEKFGQPAMNIGKPIFITPED